MKFQILYNVTLAAFIEATETFSFEEYPLTACKCSFIKGVLKGKGHKGILEMPFAHGFMEMACGIGLYNAETEDVNLDILFAGMDEVLKKCESLPAWGIKFTKKDLELWAKRVKEADRKSSKPAKEEEDDE